MRLAAALPAIGLLAGCAAGLLIPRVPVALGYGAMALCAALAMWGWSSGRPTVVGGGVLLAFLAGGVLLAGDAWQKAWRPSLRVAFESLAVNDRTPADGVPDGPEDEGAVVSDAGSVVADLRGVLKNDASARENGISLSLDVRSLRSTALERSTETLDDEIAVEGGVLLTVAGTLAVQQMDEWLAGRHVRVQARLRRAASYRDPGVPDEERALARRGTILVGSVKSGALVEVTARGSVPAEVAASARSFARRAITRSVGRWSPQSAAIVTAIVVGDRAGLSPDVQRQLQNAGTYHVIAISGGNIAILAGLVLAGFRVAGWLGRTAMSTAIAGLLAYCYLVGGGASVERATLMAVIYFAGRAADLRGPPLNALAVAAAVLVAAEPLAVADVGFLLTFGATLGILIVVPLVSARKVMRPLLPILMLFVSSAAAEIVLLPVGAFLFSRVTVAGLALNFIAIPLMAVVQVTGIGVLPAVLMSAKVATGIGWIAHIAAEGLVRSADLVRVVPALTWRVAPPSAPAVVAYYGGLLAAFLLWRRRVAVVGSGETPVAKQARRLAMAVACVAALWIVAEPWTVWSARGDGRLHVTFLDVGQGDAILVRFPRGSALLVDTGGLAQSSAFDVGDRVVAPVLRQYGIRRLSSVVLTHGHADHVGGAVSILREFHPFEVWEGIPVPQLRILQTVHAVADEVGARWVTVQAGDRLSLDGVQLVAHYPGVADWERRTARNDDSIVLELVWNDVSIVLTGDIGREVEDEVAGRFARAPIRVVKVPHHGSAASSSAPFVESLAPRVAVVSVGGGNAFGHPAPQTLERYRQSGAAIFRTDRDGAVMLETDGQSLRVRSFAGRSMILP